MLMDILMEALMSMDDESLDYVLESCDAEELEIISDAMEARFEDGPTVVDKKDLRRNILTTAGNNYAERKLSKTDYTKQIAERLGRDKIGGSTKYAGGMNRLKIARLDTNFNKLNNEEKALKKRDYEEDRKEAVRGAKINSWSVGNGRTTNDTRNDRQLIHQNAYGLLKNAKSK